MINSTKFWIAFTVIVCMTVIEGILVWNGHFEYTNRYFEFMIGIAGLFVGAKTYQNLSFKNGNGNGKKTDG